jgi:hypothetical protein
MREEHFDNHGNTIFCKVYGEYIYDSLDSRDSWNSYTSYADTTKYDFITYSTYHYKDTFLISETSYKINPKDYRKDEADTSVTSYNYNSKGLLTEKRIINYERHNHGSCIPDQDRTWGFTKITFYAYDNRNNLTLDSFGSEQSTDPRYLEMEDDVPHKVDSINHARDKSKHIVPKTVYTYNDKNQLVSEEHIEEQMPGKQIYKYPKNSLLTIYSPHGKTPDTDTIKYTYDEAGRIIKETATFSYVGTIREKLYSYFPDKRLIKQTETRIPSKNSKKKPYTLTYNYTYE